ncbi:MAG: VCBS repeat-containing protein, partial [Planctomycetaceae bacterium]
MKSLLPVCLVLAAMRPLSAEEQPSLADFYGFRELEVYKVTERSGNLLAGDVNHDGLTDLVIGDNSHHRIDLWIQRKTPPAESKISKANDITDSWRFQQQKLPVDQELFALTLGDFNGDSRTDIAHFGAPDKLIIRFQPEQGEWKDKTQQRIPDVAAAPWCLAAGDLDHNGLDDLVILGKHETTILYQKEKGTLTSGAKLLNTSDKLGLVQVADLDGDQRHDLCYLAGDGLSRVLCCRLQSADGLLGPEYVFDLERPRAVTLRDVDGKPGFEILTIDSRTGRLKMFQVRMQPVKPGELPERLIAYGFGKQGAGKDRDWALADFNGDQLTDLIVSDPAASRLLMFRQFPQRGLDLGTPFPALSDIDELHAADFDRDGRVELIVHSGKEKIVGVSRYDGGRMTFPTALSLEADVAALEVADVDGDGGPELAVLSKVKKGKETEYQLQALRGQRDGNWTPITLGKDGTAAFTLKGTPERLRQVDLNRDGRADFVIFQGTSKPPQTFLSDAGNGTLTEVITAGSQGLPAVSSSAMSLWQTKDQTGLLVSQENFTRLLTFQPPKQWQVADQYNVAESNAGIAAAVAIELDGQG